MAKKRRRKRLKKSAKIIISLIIILASVVGGLIVYENGGISLGGGFGGGGSSNKENSNLDDSAEGEGDPIKIYFLDVGQADCTVIVSKAGNMIIDAGANSSQKNMKSYIDKLGIKEFKYAIFTHPHEDHIGGAEVILDNYK